MFPIDKFISHQIYSFVIIVLTFSFYSLPLSLPDVATAAQWFPFTYLLLFCSGACTVFTFSFVDGFFLCSCLYISGVFRLVQQDIRSVFADLHAGEWSQ